MPLHNMGKYHLHHLYMPSRNLDENVSHCAPLGIPLFTGKPLPQWAFTCSKLTIETLEQGVKYVQS